MVRRRKQITVEPMEDGGRREEILKSAAELFYRHGYHATTVQDVAEKVGLLKGSLYYYISSKEDLLYVTLERVVEKGDQILVNKLARGEDPVEKLRLAMEAEIEYIINNQVTVGLFLHEFQMLSHQRGHRIINKMRQFESRYVEIIKEGQAAGRFIDVDPQLAAYAIIGMCNWVYRWYRAAGDESVDEIKSIFSCMILDGIVKERAD